MAGRCSYCWWEFNARTSAGLSHPPAIQPKAGLFTRICICHHLYLNSPSYVCEFPQSVFLYWAKVHCSFLHPQSKQLGWLLSFWSADKSYGRQIVRTAFLLWFALDKPYGDKLYGLPWLGVDKLYGLDKPYGGQIVRTAYPGAAGAAAKLVLLLTLCCC